MVLSTWKQLSQHFRSASLAWPVVPGLLFRPAEPVNWHGAICCAWMAARYAYVAEWEARNGKEGAVRPGRYSDGVKTQSTEVG